MKIRIYAVMAFFLTTYLFASNTTKQLQIDNLLEFSDKSFHIHDDLKSLEYAKKAMDLAKDKDVDRFNLATLYVSRALCYLQMQKESLKNIESVIYKLDKNNDRYLYGRFVELKANNFHSLGLTEQSRTLFNFLESFLIRIEHRTKKEEILLAQTYLNLSEYEKGEKKLRFLEKESKILQKFDDEDVYKQTINNLDAFGYYFMDQQRLDSAYTYFNKAYILRLEKGDSIVYPQYCAFADYFKKKNELNKSLKFYLKTENNIEKFEIITPKLYVDIYEIISMLYGQLGENEKQVYYIEKFNKISRDIEYKKNQNINEALKIILKDKDLEVQKEKRISVFLLISLTVLLLLFIGFLCYAKRNREKTFKKVAIVEKKIKEKEIQNEDLKNKVNTSLVEVIQLAKTNDSSFLYKFEQIYPDFTEKLLEINPNLVASELRFCALSALNFSIKEMASFTFTSPKTIQNKRTRMKKRLQIPDDEKFQIWLSQLLKD